MLSLIYDQSCSNLAFPSKKLPLTFISMEDWALVTFKGIDTQKYLQNQLTCDIFSLDINHFQFAAHCNFQGKIFSNICIFYYNQSMAFIERRSVRDNHLSELKKYAMFSKITINADDEVVLLGIAGFQVQMELEKIFKNLPNIFCPVIHYKYTTLLYFKLPTPRFLLITNKEVSNYLQQKFKEKAIFKNSQQWLSLDIEAGYPIIDNVNFAKFIPQSVNLQLIDGISFNKGCYLGQEIVARTQYYGTHKRTLCWLVGKSKNIPTAGCKLEVKRNKHWLIIGTILASCKMNTNNIWIQAVLNNKIASSNIFRLYNDNNSEFILKLLF
ncbi:tRNA-modifying protein YgfZ [Candidatus Mikella endobia]|uniref:tRNA-modifying protein YgfZ n=1 Tax=Candidatus Mikella endobia TaxID=1778264 RepID=A0A143WSK0_9ENTR|nr:tRNA-modifying protein YgfZ [Candidatus Mikella endobia]CUX95859.1 tRNA-modifying protein YgfZ [Candidatus Mikella endobia]